MPFRTRDFALFLLIVAFLMAGIASTIHGDLTDGTLSQSAAVFEAGESEEVIYVAELEADTKDTRGERLKDLRNKITALALVPVAEEKEPEPVTREEEPVPVSNEVMLCANYAASSPVWSPAGVSFEIIEGARLVYRPLTPTVTVNELGEEISSPDKEVLAQLPLRTFPQAEKSCIPTDVIGVALDGSLIRNNEHTLYQVFGADTRIGYALDGFALFGTAPAGTTLDACGGATVAGEYRYYLTPERDGILGCYSGAPITL